MSGPPTVGLVGCGRWGERILAALVDLGTAVSVVDPDRGAQAAARRVGASSVGADVGDLPDVAGLVVATPATTHAEVVRAVLDRDRPVFCEKPLTTDPEAARRLVADAGDRLHVMHVWRYHPGIEALAAAAREGELGPVRGLRSVRVNGPSPRLDTDPVWTLLPHDLSIAVALLGAVPVPRAALADVVHGRALGLWALCGGDGRPWLAAEVSTRFGDKRREVRLHGEEAVAVLPDDHTGAIRIEADGGVEERPFDPTPALHRELAAFLEHLRGGPPPRSDGAEGLAVVEAVAALRRLAGL